jgi:hypothetical protein
MRRETMASRNPRLDFYDPKTLAETDPIRLRQLTVESLSLQGH